MLKKIGRDKWKHFFVGIVLGAILQTLCWYFFPANHLISIGAAFILLFAICYGFELFSLITGFGHYEFMDVVAGTIGGALGILFVLVIKAA